MGRTGLQAGNREYIIQIIQYFTIMIILDVKIHNGPWGNNMDGLFELNDLNKATSQTAGWGLKTKQDNKQDKQQSETSEARRARLLGA